MNAPTTAAPIVLVPGFWLGAWAWDEVSDILRNDGHEVTALTLPGQESAAVDRSTIGLADHVDAIVRAVQAAGRPVVLAVHSASGFPGYAASDRVPDRIAAMVYVDTAPGISPQDPAFDAAERPMVWSEIEEGESLEGVTEDHKARFRARAVPVPGGVLRDTVPLTNDARRDIPSTFICTAFPWAEVVAYAKEHRPSFLAGLPELRQTWYVDLPTSHWAMWSRPRELAEVLSQVATDGHAGTRASP